MLLLFFFFPFKMLTSNPYFFPGLRGKTLTPLRFLFAFAVPFPSPEQPPPPKQRRPLTRLTVTTSAKPLTPSPACPSTAAPRGQRRGLPGRRAGGLCLLLPALTPVQSPPVIKAVRPRSPCLESERPDLLIHQTLEAPNGRDCQRPVQFGGSLKI